MADKFIYIPNNGTLNWPFCRLQLVVQTLKKQSKYNKSPQKLLSLRIRKGFFKTLGTNVINSQMFPPWQKKKLLWIKK